uniref:POU class 6 homeobox 1 n=1 Tax=Calidris pygmaea TaxID=425635 RepID=A0A8C3JBM2_9CHAR
MPLDSWPPHCWLLGILVATRTPRSFSSELVSSRSPPPCPGAGGDSSPGVIVMSSHETIRVLEVGVDAPLPAEEDRKAPEMPPGEVARGSPGETVPPGTEDVPPSTQTKTATGASPSTAPPLGTFGHPTSQQPQTVATPLAVIAGQVAGQQGLAVWTFPTATVAALPGLTAPSPTGGIFKPPIANLQGKPPPPPRHGCSSASQPPRFILLDSSSSSSSFPLGFFSTLPPPGATRSVPGPGSPFPAGLKRPEI